jgi:hypothetical protein
VFVDVDPVDHQHTEIAEVTAEPLDHLALGRRDKRRLRRDEGSISQPARSSR